MFSCNPPDDRYPWQSSLGCVSGFSSMVTLTSISVSMNGIIGYLPVTTESTGGMNAYSVQVRFKSGDFPTVTTITATTTETTTAKTTATTTTTLPVPGMTTTLPAPVIDLTSPSAFAGAGCTAAIFLLALLASLACFYIRRTKTRKMPCVSCVPQDPQERPLLADGSLSYRSTGRLAARGQSPPPPYFEAPAGSSRV